MLSAILAVTGQRLYICKVDHLPFEKENKKKEAENKKQQREKTKEISKLNIELWA